MTSITRHDIRNQLLALNGWLELSRASVDDPDRMLDLINREQEIAAIIGRVCRDLDPRDAESAIAGYCVLNDWSARDLQRAEMKVGLGPAKGKDFATSLGPWLTTPDEIADRRAGKGPSGCALPERS